MNRPLACVTSLGVLACFLGSTTGCTVLGCTIGSSVPQYQKVRPSSLDDDHAETRVHLETSDGTTTTGKLRFGPDPLVVFDPGTGTSKTIDPATVTVAEKQVGSEWAAGMFMGFFVD